jgi:hypothetical protein
MSMRLSHEERETIREALEEYMENISGEAPETEKVVKRLQKRLDNWFKVSLNNRAGGSVAAMKRRHKLQDVDNFLKGFTGKNYEEWMQTGKERSQ